MGDVGRSAQAIASIADASIAAGATLGAAGMMKSAADHAADNQLTAARESNALQKTQFDTTQKNLKPWLDAGQVGLNNIKSGLTSKYDANYGKTFNAATQSNADPTFDGNTQFQGAAPFHYSAADLANDPGYQFTLQQGLNALNASNNATGITGGAAAKAIAQYTTGLANTTYNDRFNQAQSAYQMNYSNAANTFGQNYERAASQAQQNFANQESQFANNFNRSASEYTTNYNQFENDKNMNFNRAASLAGLGQTATSQLNNAGASYANNAGNNLTNAANLAGQYRISGATAGAAGLSGLSNALTNGINGYTNAYSASQAQLAAVTPGFNSSFNDTYYNTMSGGLNNLGLAGLTGGD